MNRRLAITSALLGCALLLLPCVRVAAAANGQANAVVYDGKLVHLDDSSRIRVWNLPEGDFDAVTTTKLAGKSLTHLWAGGGKLWAVGKPNLYSWTPADSSWKGAATFDAGKWRPLALCGAGGSPLLVFQFGVMDPLKRRTYTTPLLNVSLFRCLATDSLIWTGFGNGEWGGYLIAFNPKTGKWARFSDSLHYVTGITQAKPGEIIVSWSMDHFMADTLIRVHGPDGKPLSVYPELQSKYYQTISHNPYDGRLYGVENDHIVLITDGIPENIARLDGQVFENEPQAIGVAPGIEALLPIAPGTLIVVPNRGLPWLLKDGELVTLPAG